MMSNITMDQFREKKSNFFFNLPGAIRYVIPVAGLARELCVSVALSLYCTRKKVRCVQIKFSKCLA